MSDTQSMQGNTLRPARAPVSLPLATAGSRHMRLENAMENKTNPYMDEVVGEFRAFCGGGNDKDGNMEDCISMADLKGGGFALRDTKSEGAGMELRGSEAELIALGRGLKEKYNL